MFSIATYDLSIANRVRVTVYGKILDKNYTQLLHADTELNYENGISFGQSTKERSNLKREF